MGVPLGPRGLTWRATAPHTLFWVEALDGGDPRAEVAHRDRLMRLRAPFDGEAEEVVRTEHRMVSWSTWTAEGSWATPLGGRWDGAAGIAGGEGGAGGVAVGSCWSSGVGVSSDTSTSSLQARATSQDMGRVARGAPGAMLPLCGPQDTLRPQVSGVATVKRLPHGRREVSGSASQGCRRVRVPPRGPQIACAGAAPC